MAASSLIGYHMPGDVVGLDGIGTERHASQAIALEDSEVCPLPFDRLEELARTLPSLQHNLHRILSRDIGCDQNMMLVLGSRRGEERLAAFLLDLSDRYRRRLFVDRIRSAPDARRDRQLPGAETGNREPAVFPISGSWTAANAGAQGEAFRHGRAGATRRSSLLTCGHWASSVNKL